MIGNGPPSVERRRAEEAKRRISMLAFLMKPKFIKSAFRVLYWIVRLARAFDWM